VGRENVESSQGDSEQGRFVNQTTSLNGGRDQVDDAIGRGDQGHIESGHRYHCG
jgi:hypothetical protein